MKVYLHWRSSEGDDGVPGLERVYGSARRAIKAVRPDIDPVALRGLAKALTAGNRASIQFSDDNGDEHQIVRRWTY